MKQSYFSNRRLTRNNKGFSLVELIVVIAIMAILAGVGTAGYSKYIEYANKNADKTLVGNLMRAVETGTNSTMFVPSDSIEISATTYPVGFIALNTEGAKVITSSSTKKEVSGECSFETKTVTYVVETGKTIKCSQCDETERKPFYEKKITTISYCTTHSQSLPSYPSGILSYAIEYADGHTSGGCGGPSHDFTPSKSLTIDSSEFFIENIDDLYEPAESGKCEFVVNGGLVSGVIGQHTNHPLYQAIDAAYDDVNGVKLKYNGWTSKEGLEYATFYAYAPQIFEIVSDQTGLLINAVNNPIISGAASAAGYDLSSFLTEGSYESSADLLDSFSKFLSTNVSAEKWDIAWENAINDKNDEYMFGLEKFGAKNDYIWAARIAYNSSFASYCDANGIASTYTDIIVDYGDDEIGGLVRIPSVVNNYAFSKTGEGSLKESFIKADATNGSTVFEQCKTLYAKYVASPVHAENGSVFYTTTQTLAATGDIAMDKNNGFGGDYFAYYNSYLKEMADLYKEAQKAAGDGIIIIVSVENGVVTCDVSPSAANPRIE